MGVQIKKENAIRLLLKCFLPAFIYLHKVREVNK